jgi:glycosyltransferase involved in cell wall biosynthesis
MNPISLNPLVSVIIPNYNYGQYLKCSIESVLNQTYKNIELIVVDDGSTDNSVEIALSYGEKLVLICQENSGVSAARNKGLANTSGTYVCFLDSDDSWEPEKVESQIALFNQPNIGLVYSSINICDTELKFQSALFAQFRGNCQKYFYKFPIRSIVLLGCSSAMIKKNVICQVGIFDIELNTSADWDYFRRISEVTNVDFVERPLVNYRRHNGSMSSGSLMVYYDDNELAVKKFLKKVPNSKLNRRKILRSRVCWMKFQLGAIKALLREKEIGPAIQRTRRILQIS